MGVKLMLVIDVRLRVVGLLMFGSMVCVKDNIHTLMIGVFHVPSRRRTGKKTVYQYDGDKQPR